MNSKIITAVISSIIMLAGLYFGLLVGSSDYGTISVYFVITAIIWYIIAGWRITWMIAAFFCFTGFTIQQGFLMEARHLLFFMVVCAAGISIFNRKVNGTAPQIPILFRQAGLQLKLHMIGLNS